MSILTIDDFENGRYGIPLNPEQEIDLGLFIDQVELDYLPTLFGKELYDLFIADLALPVAGEPTDARFIKVFNPFIEQPDIFVQSKGIKEMLKGFVYYTYVKDQVSRVMTIGIKKTTGENSENVSAIHHDILCRYNDAIATYCAIQWWMDQEDPETYPEFEGLRKNFDHPY